MTDVPDSRQLGELIGEGRTAQVFAWGADRVVKLLRPGFPDQVGQEEAFAARLADDAAIGAPRFFGVARVDGRMALVYERRDGISMMERLTAGPWRAGRLAAALGRMHAAINDAPATSLPRHRDAVLAAIRRAEPLAGASAHDAALARLEVLPDGTALCHGDFHPGNVMLADAGATVIDWLTASSGPPAADVARSLLLMRDGALPDGLTLVHRWRIRLLRRWFVGSYLKAYRHARPLDRSEVAAWRLPMLVARLDEGIVAERPHLRRLIDQERQGSGREEVDRLEK